MDAHRQDRAPGFDFGYDGSAFFEAEIDLSALDRARFEEPQRWVTEELHT